MKILTHNKSTMKTLLFTLLIMSVSSFCQDTTYQYIQSGKKISVVEEGGTWKEEVDHVWHSGTKKYLKGGANVAGDFTVYAVLNLKVLDGTAAAFQIGSHIFGFEGSTNKIFTEGGGWPVEFWGSPEDHIVIDRNFTLVVSRVGNEITFKIDDSIICTKSISTGPLTPILRPWRNTMRVFEFYAESDVIEIPERITIFKAGESGYSCYRIPAIIKAPNNDLLAFAEARVNSCSDHGNIDIVMKKSNDNGATWGDSQRIVNFGNHVAGNPAPVVDEVKGNIWLAFNTSSTDEKTIRNGTHVREVWVISSEDNGETWGKSTNITLSVHKPKESSLNSAYTFSEDWRWYAVTPGHALMLKSEPYAGRLLIPANHTTPGTFPNVSRSHVFWSDDHGETWVLGGDAPLKTNEVTAVELVNGDVLLNMRHYHGGGTRGFAKSKNGGATFGELFYPEELTSPVVQGSIIRYTTTEDSDKNRILASNPNSASARVNMTIRTSYDEGETWPYSYLVEGDFGAYSDLVIQQDMKVGIFYEGGNNYGSLFYKSISLKTLTGRNDSIPVEPSVDIELLKKQKRAAIQINHRQILIDQPSQETTNFHLFNLRGDLVQSLNWQSLGTKNISLGSLKPGVYLYSVRSGDDRQNGSLIIH